MGREGIEGLADALPCGLGGSLASLTQEQFELGKDLFDRVEIRAVRRQEQQLGPGGSYGLAHGLPLWLPRLSMMTMSPGERVGTKNCST